MKKMKAYFLAPLLLALSVTYNAQAVVNGHLYTFDDPEQTQVFNRLAEELRCPKCQNQNLADSNSQVAEDLRKQVYKLMNEGKDEAEVKDFMVARYGEFVLYKPKVDKSTWVLWYGPFVLLAIGFLVVFGLVYSNKKKSAEAPTSEADLSDDQKQRLKQFLDDRE